MSSTLSIHAVKSDPLHTRSVLLFILVALLWSLGGVFFKMIPASGLAIAGGRAWIAALTIVLVSRYVFGQRVEYKWSKNLVTASLMYCLVSIFFVTANKLTTAANAIVIQYTAPVWVALFSRRFLGEKISTIDWVTIAATVCGLSLFFFDKLSPTGMLGIASALGAGICFAWIPLIMRKDNSVAMPSSILGNVLTGTVGLYFFISALPLPTEAWVALIILGVFQLGLSYAIYSIAIAHVTALEAVLLTVLEPLLNPVWVAMTQGEIPGFCSIIGAVIILGAVVIRGIIKARER